MPGPFGVPPSQHLVGFALSKWRAGCFGRHIQGCVHALWTALDFPTTDPHPKNSPEKCPIMTNASSSSPCLTGDQNSLKRGFSTNYFESQGKDPEPARIPITTSVYCLPGDEELLIKKLERKLADRGVPKEQISQMQENRYIAEALVKSFVRYTKLEDYMKGYGVTEPSQIAEMVIRRPILLKGTIKSFKKNLVRYEMLGVDFEEVGPMAVANPALLMCEHKTLMEVVRRFRDLGIRQEQLGRMLVACPSILTPSLMFKLESLLDWLVRDIKLSSQKVKQVLVRSPWLLEWPKEKLDDLKRCFRKRLGVSAERVRLMLKRNPGWLGLDLEGEILPKVKHFESEYDLSPKEVGNLFATQPGLILAPIENAKRNRDYLQGSHGLSHQDMVKIAKQSPTTLYIDLEQSLKLKVRFLEEELGKSIRDAVDYPGYFACRTSILMLRGAFLGPEGRVQTELRDLVIPSTQDFVERVAKSNMHTFEKFSNSWFVPPKWECYIEGPKQEEVYRKEDGDGVEDGEQHKERPLVFREGQHGLW
ncbi:hypothetical protein BSKO_09540 [Bryopsis sp. KO-2023]|nr:hypothetical protein BSKO_09540 [Bryopsis sp. KO-2023]